MSTVVATAPEKKTTEPKKRRISKERFLLDYAKREDGYKYEWNDGTVEKTSAMNQYQSKFFIILLEALLKTSAWANGGRIVQETDMDTSLLLVSFPFGLKISL